MVPSTVPEYNCSNDIEEGPIAATSLLPASSPTATLSSGAGLELIGDDDDVASRVAETMFSKIFGERNSTKTRKYYL
jgi:hypothetical protein